MKSEAAFVFSPEQVNYKFSETHPFNQKRLLLTVDLLKTIGALKEEDIVEARKATDEELLYIHTKEYIDAVKEASKGNYRSSFTMTYGIGTEDTPIFPNMHEAATWLVGGTLTAVDLVFEKGYKHALHLGGGLHHGFKGKASGFCIYNDISIAIEYIKRKYKARVLYVDTDAHHGDGVQWAFYHDPDVCTLSFHENGRFLFPGTGHVNERGQGKGYGYSFNVPLEAFTEDDSYLKAYKTVFQEVIEYFKPDVIITQNGADAHYYDPLTHFCGTMKLYHEIPKLAHKLAHKYCEGRWIAVGGGGYDYYRVIPRAWSIVWLEMTKQTKLISHPIPNEWMEKWQKEADVDLPSKWFDDPKIIPEIPRKEEINLINKQTILKALQPIFDRKNKNVSGE